MLTPGEMTEIDRMAISGGPFTGPQLMRNAGLAVAREILARFGDAQQVAVLCGPGNNGGDGYVVAGELARAGIPVSIFALALPKSGSDAALAAKDCPITAGEIDKFSPEAGTLVIDALFGAGLQRPLSGAALDAVERANSANCDVVAIDLPSGLSGDNGAVLGAACRANLTVTFFRKKPGHLLHPGRQLCGETVLADIGIPARLLDEIEPLVRENHPSQWRHQIPIPETDAHKYSRGAVGVFSGGIASTGAARLTAMAAQRAGAGAVTIYSPASALQVNASHLTSIMLKRLDTANDLASMLASNRCRSFVLGPGFGVGEKAREFARQLAADDLGDGTSKPPDALVLDADGLTSFESEQELLFSRPADGPDLVLTPHEGEFARLFPSLAGDEALSKLDRARGAARRSSAIVVYKGPDTIIAAPDGRAAINTNGSPWLATAGSGDVLAGVIAGFTSQGMPAFEASCAAVWLHGETGKLTGQGAIAEDLIQSIPAAFASVCG